MNKFLKVIRLTFGWHTSSDGRSISVGDITKQGYKEGEWHTIKNGKEPTINGNYDGNKKPGTKNFKYENTFWLF